MALRAEVSLDEVNDLLRQKIGSHFAKVSASASEWRAHAAVPSARLRHKEYAS
jgi:hypothetical protein